MKTQNYVLVIITFILIANLIALYGQEKEKGKLADFEEEVEKGSSSNDGDDDESSDFDDYDYSFEEDCDDCDVDDFFLFLDISHAVGKGVFNLLFISEYEINSGLTKIGYSDYPYCNSSDGMFDKFSTKNYSVYTTMNYFRESDKLTALNFNSRLSPHPAISVELNYSDFKETLKTRYDHLRMYDIFINYNRFKFENFTFWWGLGYKGIMGDNSHGAFALNLGTNIFLPNTPVSLSLNYNLGFFEAVNVHDFSPKIRYHIDRAEISLGYRHFNAGQVSINGFTLGLGFYL